MDGWILIWHSASIKRSISENVLLNLCCLQCIDTVGWASRRASGP